MKDIDSCKEYILGLLKSNSFICRFKFLRMNQKEYSEERDFNVQDFSVFVFTSFLVSSFVSRSIACNSICFRFTCVNHK
jgi:hypothetical protein